MDLAPDKPTHGRFGAQLFHYNRLRQRPWLGAGLAALLCTVCSGLSSGAQAASAYRGRLLAQGLDNPRGLLVRGSRVLVSEAGSGPKPGSSGAPCFQSGSGATLCQGDSGAIGAWDTRSGIYSRLITGLPSLAQSSGSEGTGIADLTWHDTHGLVGVFGLGGDPNQSTVSQLSSLFGQVVSIDLATRQVTPRSNLAAYEKTNNPDQNPTDVNSNPYAIQAFAGKLFATDAGSNTLLTIDPSSPDPSGNYPITSHYVFPKVDMTLGPPFRSPAVPFEASAVPTGLTADPLNQVLSIGEFTGFPFQPGAASVFSLASASTTPSQELTGFSLISDVAAGADGSLYVLEYANNFFRSFLGGSVWRVNPAGVRKQIITGLIQPTGLAVDPNGIIYVSDNADGTDGELWQFTAVPGPLPWLGAGVAWSQSRVLRRRLRQSRRCRLR
ncbi:MAG: ScyD/ScyE family protein [Synechococcaceae cyanobacterium]